VTVTDRTGLVPPAPVQVRLYVVVAVGLTAWVPLVALVPDQPPEAVHPVALVLLHVSVLDWPLVMVSGLPLSVAVGAGVELTVTVTDCAGLVPPAPVQVRL
jgi:hypothetical protein